MFDALPRLPPIITPVVRADAHETPTTGSGTPPAAGKPGSLPFTPYGGTTAPYRPKGDPKDRPASKPFKCHQCKASGFATRAELDMHNRSDHSKPGGVPGNRVEGAPGGSSGAERR